MATTIGSLDLNAFSDLYSDSTQYFWFESNSSATYGAGAHVTLVPDTTFISNPTGQNILMNTDGFSIRNGLLPMMTLDNNSLDFNIVDTTAGTYTKTATFTATGAQIGQSSGAHSVIDVNGQRFYATDGTTQLANIGYGEGVNATSGISVAPYYTLGVRKTTTTAYSSSSTYTVGDMCVYDEKMYVCVYDITTPEPWNTNHWKYYIGNYSHAGGSRTTSSGYCSHAEGSHTTASGICSHAEGVYTIASEAYSHSEGSHTTASGTYSHAEGSYTTASGTCSHAEGWSTTASEAYSHSEGSHTTASGLSSHAEGSDTTASGLSSHAEGVYTTASGYYSHAEGYYTTASGFYSHAGGSHTTAQRKSQTVIGEYNIADTGGTDETIRGDYAFIVGNGNGVPDDPMERSNALTVDWDGNVDASGSIVKDSNFNQAYSVTVSSLAGGTYLGQAIDLGEVGLKHPIFTGYDISGSGTARIHTLGHYLYKENGHWKAYIKMRNDNTSAINNFTVSAHITWI